MNRRQFLERAGLFGGLGLAGWSLWPRAGLLNPCRAGLPPQLASHALMRQAWSGLDPAKVWDMHAHLVGVGDSDSGAWANPSMDSLWNPLQYVHKLFYMNAGCVHDAPGRVDASFVARLENLMDGIPPLISLDLLVRRKLPDAEAKPFLNGLREHNPLLFDFALKRLLRRNGVGFADSVFETRGFFEREARRIAV